MYDITNRLTFVNLSKWLNDIKQILDLSKLCLIIIGNKKDLKT